MAAIQAALEAGVNFFDTAESYGDGASERLLGEVLAGRRRQVVIATKVGPGNLEPHKLAEHCDASLRRLRTDYIDLYQVHWPSPDRPIAETLSVLERLKTVGKVRAFGVSNFGKSYLYELLAVGRVESNQLAYSLLWRPIEHEVQPLCVAHGIGILCYSPLAQGLLTGKFSSPDQVPDMRARTRLFGKDRPHSRHREPGCETETFQAIDRIRGISERLGQPMEAVALAWLLTQGGVTSVVAGARNADQATANTRAAEVVLSTHTIDELTQATEAVKACVGTNTDMWQTESRLER